jgi:RNA polymerase sigma-70 factor (ECF subfamily)
MKEEEEIPQELVIEGLGEKDPGTIDKFIKQYSRPLFGVILNYTKNPADAEEILQDTFLKIINKIDTFREGSPLWPWMRRIAINNAIMWLRKNKPKQEKTLNFEDMTPAFNSQGEFKEPVFSWTLDPEDLYMNSELATELYNAIQSLPVEYRIPLILKDVEGYSLKQISSLIQLKEPTTKTRIHRARSFVRERISKYMESGK